MNSNLEGVFEDIPALKGGLGHISFCADDKLAEDLDREGHMYVCCPNILRSSAKWRPT